MSIHPCTKEYASALVDPFSMKDREVCLPATLLPLPSWKFTSRAVVNWAIGTGGCGYCLVVPGQTHTTASFPIAFTNNTYAGVPTTTFSTVAGAGVALAKVNSPYTSATGNARIRLVTCGSRTISTTPGMNRGGRICAVANPTHNTLSGGNPAAFDVSPAMVMEGFGTSELDFRFNFGGPVDPTELEFQSDDGSAPGSLLGSWSMAIYGFSSSVQTLTTELIFYWEVIPVAATSSGTVPISSVTISAADPGPAGSALAVVANAVFNNPEHQPHGKSWQARAKQMIQTAWQGFQHPVTQNVVRSLIATAIRTAGVVGSAYAGPAAAMAGQLVASRVSPKAIMPKKK